MPENSLASCVTVADSAHWGEIIRDFGMPTTSANLDSEALDTSLTLYDKAGLAIDNT